MDEIIWARGEHKGWPFMIAKTKHGVCYLDTADGDFNKWCQKRLPDASVRQDEEQLSAEMEEVISYLDGRRETFTFPVDLKGTEFQLDVWRALQDISYGETACYADIAEAVKRPSAVRAVGAAIGANPVLLAVPCHRVIGKDGKLTGFRGGLEMKGRLLVLEGRIISS